MQPSGQSYGQALPDQVERIASLFDAHLELISDVRELYQGRAALERDYAAKLQVLSRKASEKKSKLEAIFVFGEDPTKSWDATVLSQNSLNVAYEEIMNSMASSAQDHVNVADALTSQVVDVLRVVEKKNEEAKKKELQFFQKLLADRDRTYAERLKTKQKYDEECAEVDLHRQKQGRSQDDRHAERAAKQAEQQRNDMLSSKNVYILSTAVANKTKSKFYEEDLPGLEDQFQILQSRLIARFTKILSHSQDLQLGHLDVLKSRVNKLEKALGQVDPSRDQNLFIEYNVRPFTAPDDWKFEPCVTHYDTAEMSTEPAPKIFLQNKLSRCRSKLQELSPLMKSKRRDLDQLSKLVVAYSADHTLGNIDEVSDNYLEARHQLAFLTTSERILDAEIETILDVIGGDEGAQKPHTFKSSSFSIPTQCGYCKSSIWGLSKQGKTCKLCGLSVHSKCELKVPADCQQSDEERQSPLVTRTRSSASHTSTRGMPPAQTSTPSSFTQSATSEDSDDELRQVARVIFDFSPTSEFELGVSEGATVTIVEPDDGSGWVKVASAGGKNGLVPASYLELGGPLSTGPAPPPSHQGSGQFVRAIYAYEARGADELGLREGELVELSSGPAGGQHYGDGWWEGQNAKGQKGIFPSNYVEMA